MHKPTKWIGSGRQVIARRGIGLDALKAALEGGGYKVTKKIDRTARQETAAGHIEIEVRGWEIVGDELDLLCIGRYPLEKFSEARALAAEARASALCGNIAAAKATMAPVFTRPEL